MNIKIEMRPSPLAMMFDSSAVRLYLFCFSAIEFIIVEIIAIENITANMIK
jgi:hypothetical protein